MGSPPPEAQPSPAVSDRDRRLVLATSILANLLGNLGFTGLNVGLPDMERDLGLSAVMLGWIPLSLMLPMAVVAAPGARLADILGRRRTTVAALAAAILGFSLSALSGGIRTLLAGRVLSGLGLALTFTNLMAMVASIHPPHKRGQVLGYTISAVYLGLSLGPAVCGGLVGWFGWRSVFWVSALGFLPSLVLVLLTGLEQRPARGEAFDFFGAALWAAAVLALFWGLSVIARPVGPPAALLGLLLGGAFVRHSLKLAQPILEVRLFTRSRRFAFSSLAAFISYSASSGLGLILSLYLQYNQGLTAARAGLLMMTQPACQALLTPLAGRLSDRLDSRLLTSAGMAVLGAAIAALALVLTPATPIPVFLVLLAALGLGFATFAAPNSSAIIGSAPPDKVGQASGTITATRLCGQAFSLALTTLIFGLVIGPGRITADRYPDFMRAATVCFAVFSPLCLAGLAASLARGRSPA
ncbi:MAG: MFS transporter [Candidatus Adiutrix sp.]|jgi:MFS family permease|nr:MFS transporter [Candidatus Adiutrix sp.]